MDVSVIITHDKEVAQHVTKSINKSKRKDKINKLFQFLFMDGQSCKLSL